MTRWPVLLAGVLLAACGAAAPDPSSPGPGSVAPSTRAAVTPPHVSGTYPARCTAVLTPTGVLPDPACTPGKVASTDRAVVCVAGYSAAHRPAAAETNRVKKAAMRAYGVAGETELDHLVPLSLGGSNDVRNLWPQAGGVPNAKDRAEVSLLTAVCKHGASLEAAQQAIAEDWTTAVEAIR